MLVSIDFDRFNLLSIDVQLISIDFHCARLASFATAG